MYSYRNIVFLVEYFHLLCSVCCLFNIKKSPGESRLQIRQSGVPQSIVKLTGRDFWGCLHGMITLCSSQVPDITSLHSRLEFSSRSPCWPHTFHYS